MTVVNFPESPADVRTAIQVVIDYFDDYSPDGTKKINAAKRLLLDYLSEADKTLFRPAIDVGDIGIGVYRETPIWHRNATWTSCIVMMNMDAPQATWFQSIDTPETIVKSWFQSGVDSDTIVKFCAKTTGENFVVHMRGPLCCEHLQVVKGPPVDSFR
jgi:hypothetical protein